MDQGISTFNLLQNLVAIAPMRAISLASYLYLEQGAPFGPCISGLLEWVAAETRLPEAARSGLQNLLYQVEPEKDVLDLARECAKKARLEK